MRIDLDVEVKIIIVGARGDIVVATAVGCGDNPVGTGYELDVGTLVDVLSQPILGLLEFAQRLC